VLIEALAGLRDRPWSLHCVGSLSRDQATVQTLRQTIANHGLAERVLLHGQVDEVQLNAHYARADVFVLPSYHEGYGMVLAEALARGLPILSTAVGAIPETVPPDARLLVPPGDAAALQAALGRLMHDEPLRASLAAGAQAARARLPNWQQAVSRFAQALSRQPMGAAQPRKSRSHSWSTPIL
jgi:glycosyltransferase involved in cell wall biosynthesis